MTNLQEGSNSHSQFENAREIDDNGNEYWSSRNLSKILEYSEYRHFIPVIERAKSACANSGQEITDHFEDALDMVQIGSTAQRKISAIRLSRYACYLVIQNADPSKEVVALGQTYFAVQTRKQEVYEESTEDEKRLLLREELKNHNTALAETASNSGVTTPMEFAIFQNHGYRGLYGGLEHKEIHTHKGLKKSQKILDHMGTTELAANLFRATQTEEKLRRESVLGINQANRTHYEVGKKVRDTIAELGGTMPENLPTYESIKSIEKKLQKKKDTKQIDE